MDGRVIFTPNGCVNGGGVAVRDALKVPLEDRVEDLEVNGVGVGFPLLKLLPELFPDLIEYLVRVTLTTEGLVAIVVFAMEVLSNKLGDELDIDDGDLEGLPVNLVLVLSWQPSRISDSEPTQFTCVPDEEILCRKFIKGKHVLAPVFH